MSPARNRNREAKKAENAAHGAQGDDSGPPMPGSVYKADPSILLSGDAHSVKRRVVAIKPHPGPPPTWITLGRTSTDGRPGDLPSPREPACSLDKDGWWSMRFKHTIDAVHFGNDVLCPYQGELSVDARIKVLAFYDD